MQQNISAPMTYMVQKLLIIDYMGINKDRENKNYIWANIFFNSTAFDCDQYIGEPHMYT